MARGKVKGMEAGTPVIGLLSIEMHHPQSRSLKEKRMVVKAVKDRLRRRFNVAVAETGFQELWQRSMLSAVSVSSERRGLESLLESMARDVEERQSSEVVDITIELID
jgi:uncharacterized protein